MRIYLFERMQKMQSYVSRNRLFLHKFLFLSFLSFRFADDDRLMEANVAFHGA